MLNFKNISLVGDTDLFLSQPIVIKNNNFINKKTPPIHAIAGKRALQLALASIKAMQTNKTINV